VLTSKLASLVRRLPASWGVHLNMISASGEPVHD
jgi:hypothetical protein